jgi:hypothetical protein
MPDESLSGLYPRGKYCQPTGNTKNPPGDWCRRKAAKQITCRTGIRRDKMKRSKKAFGKPVYSFASMFTFPPGLDEVPLFRIVLFS